MIVVVGIPEWRALDPAGPAGRSCGVALAAAGGGSSVELVGRIGDDATGDALLIALATAGVGHVAVLRDPSRPTPVVHPPEPDAFEDIELRGDDTPVVRHSAAPVPALEAADVSLALQYLTDFAVLVVTDDVPAVALPAALEAAAFAGAQLLLLVPAGSPLPDPLPASATALAAPAGEDEGAFAALVGAYAAALDHGTDPATAFAAAAGDRGWEALDPVG